MLPATTRNTDLAITGNYEADLAKGVMIRDAAESLQWLVGDFVLAMQDTYGDSVSSLSTDLSKSLGIPANTLREYARVSRVYSPDSRLSAATWSHHQATSSAPDPTATLNAALGDGLSVRDTKRLAQGIPTGGEDTAKAQSSVVVTGANLEEAALEALGLAEVQLQRALDTMSKPGFRLTVPVCQDIKGKLLAVSKPFVAIEEAIEDEAGAHL